MRYLATILFFGLVVGAAYSQSTNPAAANPKPAATPQRAGEDSAWDKATTITDPTARISALRKFVVTFPRSARASEAFGLISTAEAGLGNENLAANDPKAAMKFIRAAIKDAPKPVPDQLFNDTLSKFPANLYFRGLRNEGFEIAKALEVKADTNANQLQNIATFYISVENGSEARRVAENMIKIDPNSSAGYQVLGLANRVDFKLEESAAAYAKALEVEPNSNTARRGLAEMKRSLGKSDEAIVLYREILAKEEANVPARTGLILALFDADKRADAEAEMAKALEANPGNVILLAGAAYWYAAHNEGALAITLAQKAIDADKRFVWSHIALARGYLSQNKPVDAERTLLAARQYGNFPTLEYEIASARLAAGLYREAAEELSKSFSVKDGVIHTNLGGRVPSESKVFTELVGFERRASIFAPTAADNPDNAAQLRALLEFKQELGSPEPRSTNAADAGEEFIRGDDKMKVYRQVFIASELLEKKIALPKVIEIAKAAPSSLDAGLDISEPATAVMASELYETRTIAASRGEFVNVPSVPRPTLSAVLRGRIEEISGWAFYQMDDAAQAVVHLKRATGVFPVDSAWWRTSTWRLGTALVVSGNDAEALEAYIRCYKSTGPDALRYNTIEAVYKRVKGSTIGLEQRIGPNPSAPNQSETVSQKIEPAPQAKTDVPPVVPIQPAGTPRIPSVVPIERGPTPTPAAVARPLPTPDAVVNEHPKSIENPLDVPSAAPTAAPTVPSAVISEVPTPETTPSPTPPPTVEPTSTINANEINKKPLKAPAQKTNDLPVKKQTIAADATPKRASRSTPVQKTPKKKRAESSNDAASNSEKPAAAPKELFPPVVITIPAVEMPKTTAKAEATGEPSPTPTAVETKQNDEPRSSPASQPAPEIKPCNLTVSDESLTLKNGEGSSAVIIGSDSDKELDELKVVLSSPDDISVRREVIEGVKTRVVFVVRSTSAKTGIYQVTFEMPCGKKEIVVKVQ